MLHGPLQFLQYIEILLDTLYYDQRLGLPCKKENASAIKFEPMQMKN